MTTSSRRWWFYCLSFSPFSSYPSNRGTFEITFFSGSSAGDLALVLIPGSVEFYWWRMLLFSPGVQGHPGKQAHVLDYFLFHGSFSAHLPQEIFSFFLFFVSLPPPWTWHLKHGFIETRLKVRAGLIICALIEKHIKAWTMPSVTLSSASRWKRSSRSDWLHDQMDGGLLATERSLSPTRRTPASGRSSPEPLRPPWARCEPAALGRL